MYVRCISTLKFSQSNRECYILKYLRSQDVPICAGVSLLLFATFLRSVSQWNSGLTIFNVVIDSKVSCVSYCTRCMERADYMKQLTQHSCCADGSSQTMSKRTSYVESYSLAAYMSRLLHGYKKWRKTKCGGQDLLSYNSLKNQQMDIGPSIDISEWCAKSHKNIATHRAHASVSTDRVMQSSCCSNDLASLRRFQHERVAVLYGVKGRLEKCAWCIKSGFIGCDRSSFCSGV